MGIGLGQKLKLAGKKSVAVLAALLPPSVHQLDLIDALGYVENAGVPTSVTPDFIGQLLFDTSGLDFYIAFGVASGNWSPIAVDTLTFTELASLDGILATVDEINRAADVSTRIVNCTASTLTVTEALHDGKTIVLDRAAGIAVTLPVASAGLVFRFIVKTTFTGASSIKSVAGTDIMIGRALMGNDSDNTVVAWPAVAADTFDTIDLLGTANSTGGMAGQVITIEGLAANLWEVNITGDAAGTEATPFQNTVA